MRSRKNSLYTDGTDQPGFHCVFIFFRVIRLFPCNPCTGFSLIANDSHLRYDDFDILNSKLAEVSIED